MKFSRGSVTPLAVMFTLTSMLLTVGFLNYSMSNKSLQDRRIAREKALLMAETGLNFLAIPKLGSITNDTIIVWEETAYPFDQYMEEDMGTYKMVKCSTYIDANLQTIYFARATGVAIIPSSGDDPIKIERTIAATLFGQPLSDYMYFTQSEEPGGGPYTDGSVSFGNNDVLEGKVHTNGHINISNFGCPEFIGEELSSVGSVEGISWGMCDSSIFSGAWDDSAKKITYPPVFSVDLVKNSADFTFTADDLLYRSNKKDSLIMTEIEFVSNGFKVMQWPYVIPPLGADGANPITYLWDTDTMIFTVDDRRIGFGEGFHPTNGYILVDTVIATIHDKDDNDVFNELNQYVDGDTLFVASASPDSNKVWYGVIQNISASPSRFVFTVLFDQQSFPTGSQGFYQGEEVIFHYLAASVGGPRQKFENYHSHPNDGYSKCTSNGFHHFDFDPPVAMEDYIFPPTTFHVAGPKIIYVRQGQVRVKGVVDGQYTIVTDGPTEYRRHDNSQWDRCYNNIWLIDDIVYRDSNPITGEVVALSPHRLGLISGANVIIANTAANGWKDQATDFDIKINAAIMALDESFVCHYWQNTLTDYHSPNAGVPDLSLADGRGPWRATSGLGAPTYTGVSDIRGVVNLWGSIIQLKRGYMKRNSPGPYSAFPGVGYDKNYNFDYNLWIYPPPKFPISTDDKGDVILVMNSYREIKK